MALEFKKWNTGGVQLIAFEVSAEASKLRECDIA